MEAAIQGLFIGSISLTALSGAALSAFLLLRAGHAPGARQLAAFVVVVGLYALGLLAPAPLGALLMGLAPLGSAVSVDFVTRLTRDTAGARMPLYLIALAASLVEALFGVGDHFTTAEGLRGFRYSGGGLVGVAAAVGIAVYGNWVMLRALQRESGKRQREIALVLASSVIGLSTVVSFAPPLFGVYVAPWSILALPLYPAVLVYGILRYELMDANLWARRAAAYALVVALAAAFAAFLAAAPLSLVAPAQNFAGLWSIVALAMLAALALRAPIERVADRMIYAQDDISAATLAQWRSELLRAATLEEMQMTATTHLRAALRLDLEARVGGAMGGAPALRCAQDGEHWRVTPAGFEEAPPGVKRLAIVYADLLAQCLDELARRRAQSERERLAELGLLAATIAHDLRNPLNILNMAAADAPTETRREIAEQTRRMNRLVADLLDYAKPWAIAPEAIDLGPLLTRADASAVAPNTRLLADRKRVEQALDNLLANARAAGGRVTIFAHPEEDATVLEVCDDGPGVPDEIRDEIFEPFVSRSSEGTGLGLAIVARVMAAHGGSVRLASREGFSTCIRLRFPQ
jgi:signal transduction histidine kinase